MSTKGTYTGPTRVGTIRPSQAIHSYGVGSLIDLPNLSVMVGGLDRWDVTRQAVITEERLLAAVQARLGPTDFAYIAIARPWGELEEIKGSLDLEVAS